MSKENDYTQTSILVALVSFECEKSELKWPIFLQLPVLRDKLTSSCNCDLETLLCMFINHRKKLSSSKFPNFIAEFKFHKKFKKEKQNTTIFIQVLQSNQATQVSLYFIKKCKYISKIITLKSFKWMRSNSSKSGHWRRTSAVKDTPSPPRTAASLEACESLLPSVSFSAKLAYVY